MKKRPAYLQDIVNRANIIFKMHKVNNPYQSDLFMMVDKLLIDHDCYKGYGIFITEERIVNGEVFKVDVFPEAEKYGVDRHNVESIEGVFVQLY